MSTKLLQSSPSYQRNKTVRRAKASKGQGEYTYDSRYGERCENAKQLLFPTRECPPCHQAELGAKGFSSQDTDRKPVGEHHQRRRRHGLGLASTIGAHHFVDPVNQGHCLVHCLEEDAEEAW